MKSRCLFILKSPTEINEQVIQSLSEAFASPGESASLKAYINQLALINNIFEFVHAPSSSCKNVCLYHGD